MSDILFNLYWYAWNSMLALVAVALSHISLKRRPKLDSYIFFLLAILFVPNTIYITTDIAHLFRQWGRVEFILRPLLLAQYIILIPIGIWTFFITVVNLHQFMERLLKKTSKQKLDIYIVILNLVIAFGVVIGRVQRANSWHVFTQPLRVYNNIVKTLISPELMLYVVIFGLFSNLIYFALRKKSGVGERT